MKNAHATLAAPRGSAGLGMLLAATLCFLAPSCSESEPSDVESVSAPELAQPALDAQDLVPSLEDLEQTLSLDEAQLEAVRTALAKLRLALADRLRQRSEPEGSGYGPRAGSDAGEELSPQMDFILECAESLDHDQLIALLGVLAERAERPLRADHRERRRRGPDAEGDPIAARLEAWSQDLNLTPEQLEQLRAIFAAHREALQDARTARREGGGDGDLRERMRALRERIHDEIAGVLTPEQLQTLEEARAARHAQGQEERAAQQEARLDRHLEFLTALLELSAQQTAGVREIVSEARAQVEHVQAMLRDGSLGRRDARERIEEVHASAREAIRNLLDPEQQEIFAALEELRGRRHPPGLHGWR